MRNRLTIILMITVIFSGVKTFAQADISMATHWYNRANYNPASIAKTEYLYFFSNVRQQWLGIDGAPTVFNVQVSEYIHPMRSAFGISLVGDKIGVTRAYNPMLTYAYRIANDPEWSFSMGISAGVFGRFIDGSLYEPTDPADPSISYDKNSTISPDANVGVEYQSKHFIFSISTTHLLSIDKSDTKFLNTNHRYASLIFKNTNPELFNYHFGIQAVNRNNLTVLEGNTGIRFKRQTGLIKGPVEIFDIGFTYRSSHQMTVLFGLNLSSNLRVGYAYDQSFISGYYPNSTHELMIECRIPSKLASLRCNCPDQGFWYH